MKEYERDPSRYADIEKVLAKYQHLFFDDAEKTEKIEISRETLNLFFERKEHPLNFHLSTPFSRDPNLRLRQLLLIRELHLDLLIRQYKWEKKNKWFL